MQISSSPNISFRFTSRQNLHSSFCENLNFFLDDISFLYLFFLNLKLTKFFFLTEFYSRKPNTSHFLISEVLRWHLEWHNKIWKDTKNGWKITITLFWKHNTNIFKNVFVFGLKKIISAHQDVKRKGPSFVFCIKLILFKNCIILIYFFGVCNFFL